MKLSERVLAMMWAFKKDDDRRQAVALLADDIEVLEQYAEKLEQCIEAERARVAPVAHAHSPVVVDSATSMESGPVVYVDHAPVDERKVAEAYREKVLAEYDRWAESSSDTRSLREMILSVDLP